MSVLKNLRSGLKTALDAVSGFEPYLPTKEASDVANNCHRKFYLRSAGGRVSEGGIQAGGTALDLVRTLELVFHWNPEGNESTIDGTIEDDELSIWGVVLKPTNWAAGTRLVIPTNITREDVSATMIRFTYEFEATYLETVDVS